jgi:hypothetical protein
MPNNVEGVDSSSEKVDKKWRTYDDFVKAISSDTRGGISGLLETVEKDRDGELHFGSIYWEYPCGHERNSADE